MSCPRCGVNNKLKARTFSDQAIAAMIVWGEMSKEIVDQPICDDCYEELREVLIDRSDEVSKMDPKGAERAS